MLLAGECAGPDPLAASPLRCSDSIQASKGRETIFGYEIRCIHVHDVVNPGPR